MDRHKVAEKIRQHLEGRISKLIGCVEGDLRCLKLGMLVHFLFMLEGPSETIGGFNASMGAVLDLLGHEIVWAKPKHEDEESPETKVTLIQ